MPSTSAPRGLKVPAKGPLAALNHSRVTSGKATISAPAERVTGDLRSHVGTPKAAARRWGDLVVRKHRRRDPTSAVPSAVHSEGTPAPSEPQRRLSSLRGFFSRILGGSRSRAHGAQSPVSGDSVKDTGRSTSPSSAATPPIATEQPFSSAATPTSTPTVTEAPRTPSPTRRRPLPVTQRDENTPSPDPTRAIWRQIRRVTQPSSGAEDLDSPEKRMQEAALANKRSLGALTLRNVRRNDEWHEEERRVSGALLDATTTTTTPSPDPARGIWMQIRRVTGAGAAESAPLGSPARRAQLAALTNRRSLGEMTVRSEAQNDAWNEMERWFATQGFVV